MSEIAFRPGTLELGTLSHVRASRCAHAGLQVHGVRRGQGAALEATHAQGVPTEVGMVSHSICSMGVDPDRGGFSN